MDPLPPGTRRSGYDRPCPARRFTTFLPPFAVPGPFLRYPWLSGPKAVDRTRRAKRSDHGSRSPRLVSLKPFVCRPNRVDSQWHRLREPGGPIGVEQIDRHRRSPITAAVQDVDRQGFRNSRLLFGTRRLAVSRSNLKARQCRVEPLPRVRTTDRRCTCRSPSAVAREPVKRGSPPDANGLLNAPEEQRLHQWLCGRAARSAVAPGGRAGARRSAAASRWRQGREHRGCEGLAVFADKILRHARSRASDPGARSAGPDGRLQIRRLSRP